ncbi:RNA polymerase II subunit A C-terminal domain phosphatase like protein [Verticillium longisporum]|nr:RNA polymerase II subunit A C-terminal domain phosphatase like protein [Verticillium longisporum]
MQSYSWWPMVPVAQQTYEVPLEMGKLLSLGARLRYPITITKLLKSKGDTIKKQEPVLEYSFKFMKEVGDQFSDNLHQEEQTAISEWASPVDGNFERWRLREGDVIVRDMPCMEVEEPCDHAIQFHGLCAVCGQDMTEVNWASDQIDTDRATVNMTHDQTGLMVSNDMAARAEHDAQRRLLRQRKLSLVVDLDQTIIHACIEPTVGEWMNDPENPNYDAVKDVQKFQLNDEGPRGVTQGCWYYIKMRPGLREFLEKVAELYELHVYTMGTRAYALNIAKIVDPQQKLFGNRVISRDENGSITSKSLQRLFPVSTNMVVIIDDRADVWPRNRPNLIKVVPYDFFKGIGDINSSFLPKRRDILPAPADVPNGKTAVNASPNVTPEQAQPQTPAKPSALDELVSMSSGNDKKLQAEQTEEQERSLEHQITDRPLAHMQEVLDKEKEEKEKAAPEEDNEPIHRGQVLRDDDEELQFLQSHLTRLHGDFFEIYDARRASRRESPPRQAPSHDKPRKASYDDGVDLSMVPDVGEVLDDLKAKVLQDTVIVLSGLVPLGIDWKHVDEAPYLVDVEPHQRRHNGTAEDTASEDGRPTLRLLGLDGEEQILEDDSDDGEEDFAPDDNGPMSPIETLEGFNWGSVDDELNEFMAGDSDSEGTDVESRADDEDGDSSDAESTSHSGTKRKAEDTEDESEDGSALAKRQRVAKDRGASKLSAVRTSGGSGTGEETAESSSLPTPQVTGDEDNLAYTNGASQAASQADTDDLDLEAAMEAEMEKELAAAAG